MNYIYNIYILSVSGDPNIVITVPAEVLVPNGDRLSADSFDHNLDMFL